MLVEQMSGTLVTIAKDVKIQVEFNPTPVAAYRLVGYENRMLAPRTSTTTPRTRARSAPGHTVTALYEIVPVGVATPVPTTDDNPFVAKAAVMGVDSEALFRLRLRYKTPAGAKSRLMEADIRDGGDGFDKADADFRWAAAIAAFGMQLRDSKHRGRITWQGIREIAGSAVDDHKDRRESLPLLDIAMAKHGVKPPAKLVKRPKTPVQVQSVRGNVVAINMTGAKVGDTFRIERGAITLGTVTVTHVHADKVVGEFKGSGVPQAGDAAVQQ